MAAISKALASSLDHLASSIFQAEEFISSSLPTAIDISVNVDRVGEPLEPGIAYWLEFRSGRLVKTVVNEMTSEEITKPLMEISIPERSKYAKFIPKLIQEATAAMEKLHVEIAIDSSEILDAIKTAKAELSRK